MKKDMVEVEVTEEDTEDRNNWRWKIRCGDPRWEKLEEEENVFNYVDPIPIRKRLN